jgi:hypothetical protein
MRAISVVIGAAIEAVIATRASAIIYLLVLARSMRPWEGSSYSHRLLEGCGWYFL